MKVLQQFCQSKTGRIEDCEDEIVVTDDFVAIFDGATSKVQSRYDGKTTGQVAAQALAEAMQMLPADANRKAAMVLLNTAIELKYEEYGVKDKVIQSTAEQFVASGIIYSRNFHEIWVVGDCLCRFGGKTYTHERLIDMVAKNVRGIYIQHAVMKGILRLEDLYKKDVGHEFIAPLLSRQYDFINAPGDCDYSYAAFNGFHVDYTKTTRYALSPGVNEIILSSDGYPELLDTLEETEDALKETLRLDPHCIHINKSTHGMKEGNISFDDRSFIRFRIGNL